MRLTEEQYKQAARYVNGEMDASEKEAFELDLQQNSDLMEEVEAYQEIRLMGESAGRKISDLEQHLSRKKREHEKVWRLIQQERANWEKQQHKADGENPGNYNGTIPATQIVRAKGKLRGMNIWRWLAVAMMAGFIALSAVWWYRQGAKKESTIVINQKEGESRPVTNNKQPDTPANTINENTTKPSKVQAPPSSTPASKGIAIQNRKKKEREVREQLVKSNFVPDSLPFQVPDALEVASTYYKDQNHEEAIKEYKRIIEESKSSQEDSEVATRSKDTEKELTKFYAHYYLAQSYLSVNYTQEAIRELDSAVEESPSIYWKSKVQWYLALACLKAGKIERTKDLLEQVKSNDPSGVYSQKAIQLGRKL
jgi:tetratricopeptide (TPR) repeat protein